MGRQRYNVIPIIEVNGQQTPDDRSVTENFNQYFSCNGSYLASPFVTNERLSDFLTDDCSHVDFIFCKISLSTLLNIVMSLKLSSSGIDDIPTTIFQKHFDVLGPVMLNICNRGLSEKIFPDKLKNAEVTPIFKAGDKTQMQNHRPFSILPACCKFIEKIPCNQLREYLSRHNLLNPLQFGFRSGLSTENAFNHFVNHVYRAMYQGE